MASETLTFEQISSHYSACIDSVNLLNAGKPNAMDDKEWEACVFRNKVHLEIMLAKDFWTIQDLSPLQDAVKSH